jgi:hypothetical protein
MVPATGPPEQPGANGWRSGFTSFALRANLDGSPFANRDSLLARSASEV